MIPEPIMPTEIHPQQTAADLPGPPEIPPPPPVQQAQVVIQSRLVVATGFFPAGSPDPVTIEIVDLDEETWAEFQTAPVGQKYLATDGTLTVTPAPPPPIRKTNVMTVDQEVRTTDDQPREVFRFPTSPRHAYRATFSLAAIDATSGATKDAEARMTFKRTAAAVVQVGATALLYSAGDTATNTWAIQPGVSGTDFTISVRGALNRTIDWLLTGQVGVYAPEGLND